MLTDPALLQQLLACADPREPVTLAATAPAATWRKMLAEMQGGPDVLSTRQCAERFGFTQAQWRRWAEEIPGALRVGKPWRIPREAAQAHADRVMNRTREQDGETTTPKRRGGNHGKYRSRKQHAAAPAQTPRVGAAVVPIERRLHRG